MRALVPDSNREDTPKAGNYHGNVGNCDSMMSNNISSANIRPISPDDVYDDNRGQRPYTSHSQHQHSRSNPNLSFQSSFHQSQSMIDYHPHHNQSYLSHQARPESRQQFNQSYISQPPRPESQLGCYRPPSSSATTASRQTSNSSNPSTANTMTSGSENWETYDDASEPEADATEVYYAKLRATQGKRMAGHGGGQQFPNKTKGIRPVRAEETVQIKTVADVSDDGWTDDLETY